MVSLEFFIDITVLGSTLPLTEMSTRGFPGDKGGRCVGLTTLPPSCAVVMKSGNLNFLEPSGPLQACNGTDLPFGFVKYTPFRIVVIRPDGDSWSFLAEICSLYSSRIQSCVDRLEHSFVFNNAKGICQLKLISKNISIVILFVCATGAWRWPPSGRNL